MPFHLQIKFFIQRNPLLLLRRSHSPKLGIINLFNFLALGYGREDKGPGRGYS